MLLHDDILIIGDSFVKDRFNETHWPYLLKQLLTNENDGRPPRGWGLAGVSWWSTRARLLNELQVHIPKILIIVHTESTRIPSDLEFPLNAGSSKHGHAEITHALKHNDNRNLFTPELLTAADAYFKYLCSIPFCEWATRRWYDELDDWVSQYKIEKVIHMSGFGSLLTDDKHVFKNGITSDEVLWNISDDYQYWITHNKFLINSPNHFSIKNNTKMANSLYQTLQCYTPGLLNLNLLA